MLILNKDQDFKVSRDTKYLCSLLDLADCSEIVLQFDNKLNMWVSEYVILSDWEVKEWIKDNCLYVVPLGQ
ncbi:MAG: hypothetical protein GXZ01_04145 [Clostridiaceae bacterium]|nr:hypothetical protein [Clostridiaceae bacterium]